MFILIILFILFNTQLSHADIYVVTAPDKSVYSVSDIDDAVVPAGYVKTILKNKKISDLTFLPSDQPLYDFDGNKFKLNDQRVMDKSKGDQDRIVKKQKRADDKASGIAKLKGLGLTDDEIKAIFK